MFRNVKIVCKSADPNNYFVQDAPPGEPEFVMASSSLRSFAHCPSRFRAGYQPPPSEAKDWGALLDCSLLTPEQFEKRYAVKPETYPDSKNGERKPWNGNATFCRDWVKEQGNREIVSKADVAEVRIAIDRLMQDEVIRAWHEASDRQVWVAGEWHDEETKIIVPVRCLLDYVPRNDTEFAKCLGDLKSTRNGALLPFQRFCYSMGYHQQGAWDTDLYVAATKTEANPEGEDRNTWVWILQENYAPYQTAKRMMSQDFLSIARAEYRGMMENYCRCLKANKWPDYDDHDEAVQGFSVVQAEPWMAERAAFAPHFNFDENEDAPEANIDEVTP